MSNQPSTPKPTPDLVPIRITISGSVHPPDGNHPGWVCLNDREAICHPDALDALKAMIERGFPLGYEGSPINHGSEHQAR